MAKEADELWNRFVAWFVNNNIGEPEREYLIQCVSSKMVHYVALCTKASDYCVIHSKRGIPEGHVVAKERLGEPKIVELADYQTCVKRYEDLRFMLSNHQVFLDRNYRKGQH